MDISVALDGAKRRDIKLYEGDTDTLNVTVYLRDGDPTSVVVPTELNISTIGPFEGTIPVGTSFTVPKGLCWRNWFTLTGVVAGARVTLAYGYVLGYGEPATPYPWGNDYGWRWPYGGNAWEYL